MDLKESVYNQIQFSMERVSILIVDDDLSVCRLFEIFLSSEGYHTLEAHSGKEALKIIGEYHVDLVILDVMMPEMDGFEVCARIKAEPAYRGIPVIFVTAIDDRESYLKGFNMGAIDYLSKPINKIELTTKVRNYLNLAWQQKQLHRSEMRYKSIVEDQTELIVRFLPDGTLSFVNNAFCSFVDKPRELCEGLNRYNKSVFQDFSVIFPETNGLSRDNQVKTTQRRVRISGNKIVWLEWVIRAILDQNDEIFEYQFVGRDITTQKQYEQAILLVTDRTSGTFGDSFFKVLLLNMVKIINAEYAVLGTFENEEEGVVRTFAACRESEITDNFVLSFANTRFSDRISREAIFHQGEKDSADDVILTIGEDEIRSFASIPLYDKNKETIGVLIVLSGKKLFKPKLVIDLIKVFSLRVATEIERNRINLEILESERKFRNLFHSSVDGIVITNYQTEILEANNSFSRHFRQDGLAVRLADYIFKNDREKFERSLAELIANKHRGAPLEIRMPDENGEPRYHEIISQIIDYQGSSAILSIIRDVADRKEMQSRILSTVMETEEKERNRFSQDLHDGLGPLLSAIKLYNISILTAKNEENKQIAINKSIEIIDEAISSIKEIANNISPNILRDFGMVVAISSYVSKFQEARKTNIIFQPNIEERLEARIESSIFRIVIELLNNTFKHAFASNILITMDLSEGNILLNYADDGIGCNLESVRRSAKGHGISNILNRAESLNADVEIRTQLDKGFAVNFIIPVNKK
ncbi:MAG: response regulator [Bacteroidota bacterium]